VKKRREREGEERTVRDALEAMTFQVIAVITLKFHKREEYNCRIQEAGERMEDVGDEHYCT
jgi:hypothetical protein